MKSSFWEGGVIAASGSAEASGDSVFARFLGGLWAEIIPTVPAPQGVVLADYAKALLARFQNPAIRHRTWQIAMDGSQKLPQRLLGTIRERLKAGAPINHLALGVAAWMRYVTGTDETGGAIDVRDPLVAELKRGADAAGRDANALVVALTGIEAIFGTDLPGDLRFTKPVTAHLASLFDKGAKATAARLG